MFSKACEYGIKASIFLAQKALNTKDKIGVKEIVKHIDTPEAFTAKTLQTLTRKGILYSIKGPSGGFYIPKEELDQITLSEIVEAIDGDKIYTGCGLGLSECSPEKPCPIHDKFKSVRDELSDMLSTTTLFELAMGLDLGLTFLKR